MKVYVYIGDPAYVTSDNIVFSVDIPYGKSVPLRNIRISMGESVLLKTKTSINLSYRYTQIARSI